MTEQSVATDLRLAVVNLPFQDRPSSTEEDAFWSGTADERSFYVRRTESGSHYIVVPESDPRSGGMWTLGDMGVENDLLDHRGWWINPGTFTYRDEQVDEVIEALAEVSTVDRTDMPTKDAYPVGSVWTHSTYGDSQFKVIGYDEDTLDSERPYLLMEQISGTRGADGSWPRSALDTYGTLVEGAPVAQDLYLTYDIGQPLRADVLRTLPAGVLFKRVFSDGLWVTHGDGTATRLEGVDNARLGIGYRDDTHGPTNSWVDDGWTYAGFDPSRVPVEVVAPLTADELKVRELEQQVETLRQEKALQEQAYEAEVERHKEDISLIGRTLLSEAENREWCGEYDQVVDGLNSALNVTLPKRFHEYEVTMDVTYRVSVRMTAMNEEQAEERVKNDRYAIYDSINRYDHPTVLETHQVEELES